MKSLAMLEQTLDSLDVRFKVIKNKKLFRVYKITSKGYKSKKYNGWDIHNHLLNIANNNFTKDNRYLFGYCPSIYDTYVEYKLV